MESRRIPSGNISGSITPFHRRSLESGSAGTPYKVQQGPCPDLMSAVVPSDRPAPGLAFEVTPKDARYESVKEGDTDEYNPCNHSRRTVPTLWEGVRVQVGREVSNKDATFARTNALQDRFARSDPGSTSAPIGHVREWAGQATSRCFSQSRTS